MIIRLLNGAAAGTEIVNNDPSFRPARGDRYYALVHLIRHEYYCVGWEYEDGLPPKKIAALYMEVGT